jgi:hypothetical protein
MRATQIDPQCDHELITNVSPAGDDYTSCGKCGGHWPSAATPDYESLEAEEEA